MASERTSISWCVEFGCGRRIFDYPSRKRTRCSQCLYRRYFEMTKVDILTYDEFCEARDLIP